MQKAAIELNAALEALTKERDKRSDLLELSRQKQAAVVKNDIDQLSNIVRLEETMLQELSVIERRREAAFDELCGALELPRNAALGAIAEKIESALLKQALVNLREDLSAIVQKQQNLNCNNKKLIQIKIEYTQNMVHAMTQAAAPSDRYNSQGTLGESGERVRLVDRQI